MCSSIINAGGASELTSSEVLLAEHDRCKLSCICQALLGLGADQPAAAQHILQHIDIPWVIEIALNWVSQMQSMPKLTSAHTAWPQQLLPAPGEMKKAILVSNLVLLRVLHCCFNTFIPAVAMQTDQIHCLKGKGLPTAPRRTRTSMSGQKLWFNRYQLPQVRH